jgi:UDP-2,3-diacylglucosamine pyrophosphatase LpxH
MLETFSYKLVIVSDLHLSEGWDENGYLQRNEDFFFDQNFERFLRYLSVLEKEEKFFYRLVINGDLVDFLQFTTVPEERDIQGETLTKREKNLGMGTSEIKTLWKLGKLIYGHKVFFTAIADFLAKGNELIIIPGNHDIEWIMPAIQESFKKRLSELPMPPRDLQERIKFLPWFYYDSFFSVFAEHGSQYDDINSFDYLLCPYRKDGTVDLPAGSFFVRYLFNRIEEIYPFADNMKPLTKFLCWAVRQFETYKGCPPQIFRFIQFFLNTLKKAGPVKEGWAKELSQRHAKEINRLAEISGMDKRKLEDLKSYWIPSALHHNKSIGLLVSFIKNSKLDKYYYREKARKVQQIVGARYVIFGHTHESDLCPLSVSPEGEKNEYVNSGSWTKSFAANYEEALLKSENEFVYVQIGYDKKKDDVKMDLLRWNDSLQEGERVRLFKLMNEKKKEKVKKGHENRGSV